MRMKTFIPKEYIYFQNVGSSSGGGGGCYAVA
jgi:hypothetical protein